jgi:primase-polymerase (primpol)-like protein
MTDDYDGVGIRVSNGFSAVDIDHCVENGVLTDLAMSIIDALQSYTEYSPSKSGVRIIFKAPGYQYDSETYYLKNPHNGCEIYVCGATNRFVTITGNTVYDYPVREVTGNILKPILDEYMLRPVKQKSSTPAAIPVPAISLSDEQIIFKASANSKFRALFEGDMSDYNNDQSSADLALCNILAFWTGKDAEQMDRIFRQSGLFRDKWLRDDYRGNTISMAIADCNEVYNPNVKSQESEQTIFERLGSPNLQTGPWDVSSNAVTTEELANKKTGETRTIFVTSTPIVPTRIMVNADTGVHKVELAFRKNGTRRTTIQDRETIASKNKIVSLANIGVDVTTATAGRLVDYLNNLQQLNDIPEVTSVSHLGWVDGKFLPYDDGVVFDGESSDKKLYNSIKTHGSESAWVEHVLELRKNKPLRMTMAASFASPLIERCGALPFVFHLWGTTGGGKTVALKTAMSIWGKPELGDLIYTMNMTDNAMMNTAGLLYSLPFAGDELQLVKNRDGYDKVIMRVTEGIERVRMKYDIKVAPRVWKNSFIFAGEEPCTDYRSGGGTKNRVVEVNADEGVVHNGGETIAIISENYGHAGETFIAYAKTQNLRARYREIYNTVSGVTDKQALAATMVLLGDAIARECLFPSEPPLAWDDIAEYFYNSEDVSTAERAREYILGWIAQNKNKFDTNNFNECWGSMLGHSVFVIDHILIDALADKGFSFDAVKRDWARSGFLEKSNGRFKGRKGINGETPYCIELKR